MPLTKKVTIQKSPRRKSQFSSHREERHNSPFPTKKDTIRVVPTKKDTIRVVPAKKVTFQPTHEESHIWVYAILLNVN